MHDEDTEPAHPNVTDQELGAVRELAAVMLSIALELPDDSAVRSDLVGWVLEMGAWAGPEPTN
jgi:hypothetical protein